MVTLIRSVADIQRIFTYNARKTIVVRTSPDRMALTAWLVKQLDRPASTPSAWAVVRCVAVFPVMLSCSFEV